MNKSLKKRIGIIILVVAVLVLYARTVPQVSLVERGIAVGMGIDFKDGVYDVSVQLIKPKSTGPTSSSDDSYAIVGGRGETVARAIQEITQKTGLIISLAQCNILILGNGVFDADVFPSVSDLVNTWQLPEQSILLTTDKTALELMRIQTVTTELSSFQIQQTLIGMSDYNVSISTTVKDFIIDYLSYSKTAVITFVTAVPVPEENAGNGGAASGGSKSYSEFDYSRAAAFAQEKKALELSAADTIAINHLKNGIKKGGMDIEVDGVKYRIELEKQKSKLKGELAGNGAEVTAELTLKYSIAEAGYMLNSMNLSDISDEVITELEQKAAAAVETAIADTFEKCKEGNYDVFMLYNMLYSSEGLRWKEIAGVDYLGQIRLSAKAKVEIVRK